MIGCYPCTFLEFYPPIFKNVILVFLYNIFEDVNAFNYLKLMLKYKSFIDLSLVN